MSCQDRLSLWETEVSTAFAHLSHPQIWGLVLWSAGIALSGSAGITQISALLALVLCQGEQTVFQRLREWYLDADQKSGKKRRDLEVSTCFAPLLGWVLRLWQSEKRQLPLVMDATSLGNRWTILAVSVVIRGCAIPVAWKVIAAQQEGACASVLGRTAQRVRESSTGRRGKSSYLPIADCMPVGSGTPLWHGAGIRSYASMWAAKHACLERRPLSGSVAGSPRRERVGKAKWNALPAKKGGSTEPC